jgi:hypothetical protein
MNGTLRLAPLVWLLSFDDVHAACEPKVEPIEVPKVEKSELQSVVIDPPAGTEVHKDTVLTVDLEYRIADFSPGQFRLLPLFSTGVNRSDTFEVDGKDPQVALESPAGRVRLCLPLAGFYGRDAESVSWPLELSLTVVKADGTGASRSVTSRRPIKLNSVDVPAAALERQAKAPPPEYEDALDFTFNHFQRRAALYKACLQRFQPLQPKLTAAYRTWEARHKADIEFVSELRFESIREHSKGRTDVAMKFIDYLAEMHQQEYLARGAAQLRTNCEELLEQVNPLDDHTTDLLADHLVVLRKWRAGK